VLIFEFSRFREIRDMSHNVAHGFDPRKLLSELRVSSAQYGMVDEGIQCRTAWQAMSDRFSRGDALPSA
jgi:hypothetical protein